MLQTLVRLDSNEFAQRATVEDMMDAINEFKSRLGLDEHGNVRVTWPTSSD